MISPCSRTQHVYQNMLKSQQQVAPLVTYTEQKLELHRHQCPSNLYSTSWIPSSKVGCCCTVHATLVMDYHGELEGKQTWLESNPLPIAQVGDPCCSSGICRLYPLNHHFMSLENCFATIDICNNVLLEIEVSWLNWTDTSISALILHGDRALSEGLLQMAHGSGSPSMALLLLLNHVNASSQWRPNLKTSCNPNLLAPAELLSTWWLLQEFLVPS